MAWLSLRQPTASLSTAEAELQAGIDCMTLAEGFTELFRELEGISLKCVLYGDNQGAVTVLQIPQGAWRTRHLRLKASWFLQQVEDNKYPVYHVPGQFMLGDICTKMLGGPRVRELLQLMGVVVVVKDEGESSVSIPEVKNLHIGSGGASTKHGVTTSSESTSRLRDLGADSGGVVSEPRELAGTSTETVSGEDVTTHPVIPNMSLLRGALRLLVAAVCVKRSQGRVVVVVDDDPNLAATTWLIGLLVVLAVVMLCVSCRSGGPDHPRIQRMRVGAAGESEDSDDWSVLSSAGQSSRGEGGREPQESRVLTPRELNTPNPSDAQDDGPTGLRKRTQKGPRLADPAPLDPRHYLTPGPDEATRVQATPQAQGLVGTPNATVDPTPDIPRYLEPRPTFETPSAAASSNAVPLGFERSERGQRRSDPHMAGSSDVLDVLTEDSLERHTSEEDGVSRNHLITDGVDPVIVPEERADVAEATFRDGREPLRLCIYPGWFLRVPPRETWPRQPEWGGYEALWHQSIPRNVLRDFYHVDWNRGILIRMHAAPRRRMFLPVSSTLPPGLSWQNLSGRRRTFVQYADPVLRVIHEDRLTDPNPQRQLARRWTGRTELEICGLQVQIG